MKLTITLCLLTLSSFVAFAQQQKIDSLELILRKTPENPSKVLILNDLANLYMGFESPKAEKLIREGLQLSQKLSFQAGEMMLYYTWGEFHHRQGNYVKGIDFLTQSLKIAENIPDSLGVANAYYMLGIIYTDGLKQYDLARQNALKALPFFERKKNLVGWSNTLNLLAWVDAITNQNLALAKEYNLQSIALAKEIKDDRILAYCLGTKALIFDQENQLDSALAYFKITNQMLEKVQDKAVIAYNNIFVGKIYLKKKSYNQASQVFEQAKLYAESVNAREFLKDAYLGLADTYAQQNNFTQAYQFQTLYTQLKDSLINWEASQKIALAQTKYEEAKQQAKIDGLEKDKKRTQEKIRNYSLFFVASLLLISIILVLIVRNNRQSKFANRLLKEKNDAIAQQAEELQLIHDEVVTQRDMLDEKVKERTLTLEVANDKLREYAFANSHKVRRPVATILGLLSLFDQENWTAPFNLEIMRLLNDTAQELDNVTREINQKLEQFEDDSEEYMN